MFKLKSLKDKYSLLELKNSKSDYVFLDLEFKCFTDNHDFYEITSIGAVKCDKHFNKINCFHAYVKPISHENTSLSHYKATYKTSRKKNYDKGMPFSKTIRNFTKWLGDTDCKIFVWGTADIPILLSNLEASGIQDKFTHLPNQMHNIQPEVSKYVKVLGNPINYSISLDNMKKLFFLNKEVSHNALLDSIDLMKIFKQYKLNKQINQDFLCELSYMYRNVNTQFQFENFKYNDKLNQNKYAHHNIDSRILINKPSNQLLRKALYTLNKCNFKFTNEQPEFFINTDGNTLLFNKFDYINNDCTFDTVKDSCEFEISNNNIFIHLNNEKSKIELEIPTQTLSKRALPKVLDEIFISSFLYKNINISELNVGTCSLINYFLHNGNMNFSNNIKNISLINDKLFVNRKKNNNSKTAPKHNCNFYLKNEKSHYSLMLNYKCSHKNTAFQNLFIIPKNAESNKLVHKLIKSNPANENQVQPRLIDIYQCSKNLIKELISKKAMKNKRKLQIFTDDDKITLLHGRYIEYINFEKLSFFVCKKNKPIIVFKNTENEKTYEFRLIKNEYTSNVIDELFKIYNKNKPKVTKISNLDTFNSQTLNRIKKLDSFIQNNSYTFNITNGQVEVKKNIKNEYENEVYELKDFNLQIHINKHYNMSILFTYKNDCRKVLSTCISSKSFIPIEVLALLKHIDNRKNNELFKTEYLSKNLLTTLLKLNMDGLIHSKDDFLDLCIQEESFRVKKEKTYNQTHMQIQDCSIEIVISETLMFFKLYDDNTSLFFSVQNNKNNRIYFKQFFKLAKKSKTTSWIKVLEINKSVRNSIWRVIENSKKESFPDLSFDRNYLKTEQRKYLYQNTSLSLKKTSKTNILLEIGSNNSTTFDISINEKNKIFIDELINNALLYEDKISY